MVTTLEGPTCPWPLWPSAAAERSPQELHLELQAMAMLGVSMGSERRGSPRWPVTCPLEGWLELSGVPEAPLPVILTDMGGGGVGAVLQAEPPLRRGQRGALITQSHGAGCQARPVRCCWQRRHPGDGQLQWVGLSFEAAA